MFQDSVVSGVANAAAAAGAGVTSLVANLPLVLCWAAVILFLINSSKGSN